MAAFEIIALDPVTPQLRAPGAGDTYVLPRYTEIVDVAAVSSHQFAIQPSGATGPYGIKLGNQCEISTYGSGFGAQGLNVTAPGGLWLTATNGNLRLGPSADAILDRDAANTLAQRNGTNAQTFRIYNTFTDPSNYERGFMRWSSNVLEIGAEAAGTGTLRETRLVGGFGGRIEMQTGGAITLNSSNGVRLTLDANLTLFSGFFQQSEIVDPAAPSANNGRLYYRDNGSGKTQLCARFATGAIQVLATEP